jgi:hypothetical protein
MELFYDPNKEYPSKTITVTQERVLCFKNSIGSSESSIKENNVEFAPLTFPTVFRELEFQVIADIGLELNHCLHADQEYRYHRALRVGEEVTLKSKISKVDQKLAKGDRPPMVFLQLTTEITSCEGDEPILDCVTLILVRGLTLKEK